MSCYELLKTFSVFVVGIQLVFGVIRWLYQNVIGPTILKPTDLRQYGKWALVTGATDGIGRAYARSLAKRGLNIILVSRTLSKLEVVAKEISESFTVETQVIAVNFTSGPEIYDQIKNRIVGKEIGILVNNVGMFYAAPEPFLNIPGRDKLIQDIINCNSTSVPMMCSLILPQMVQRKRGLIINISSTAYVIPCPNMCIYSASKAFVTKFSNDLASEYESKGIKIQVLITGGVSTNMNKIQEDSFMFPTPKEYVESALSYVGHARQANGFLPHTLGQFLLQFAHFVAPSLTEGFVKRETRKGREKLIRNGLYTPSE